MKERNISKKEIEKTIKEPDKCGKQDEKRFAMKYRKSGGLLITYYTENKEEVKIITVISTSKINKYLKQ